MRRQPLSAFCILFLVSGVYHAKANTDKDCLGGLRDADDMDSFVAGLSPFSRAVWASQQNPSPIEAPKDHHSETVAGAVGAATKDVLRPEDPTFLARPYSDHFPDQFQQPGLHSIAGGFNHQATRDFIVDLSAGHARKLSEQEGTVIDGVFVAPSIVYEWPSKNGRPKSYVVFQHGNFMIFDASEQPDLPVGMFTLYRGIGDATTLRVPHFNSNSPEFRKAQALYSQYQLWISRNPGRAFTEPYHRVNRSFTQHLKVSGNFRDYLLQNPNNLSRADLQIFQKIHNAQQTNTHFTAARSVASGKFGPHWISTNVPLDNVRISSAANNEHEVRIIDSSIQFISPGLGVKIENEEVFP